MLTRRTVLLAKLETTYNVDPNPTAQSNALLILEPDVKVDGEQITREFVRASLSPLGHEIGRKRVTVTFGSEVAASGTRGLAPSIGPLLQACGMKETVVADTSVTYTPRSDVENHKSLTLYVFFDGLLHKITGCRGTFDISGEAGQLGRINWTFEGRYVKPIDSLIPTGNFPSEKPPKLLQASFSAHGYAAKVNAFQFSLANSMAVPGDLNGADGYGEIRISGRDPNGSIDPEATLIAQKDFWDLWEKGTKGLITLAWKGGTGGTLTLSNPYAQYREISYGDREGIRTYDLPFTAAGSSAGDDELSLAFN